MLHTPRGRLAAVTLAAVAVQLAVAAPVADWHDRAPGAAAATGVAVAALAGLLGGLPAGLAAALAGWLLQLALVSEWEPWAAAALPAWLLGGGAAGWVAERARSRARARDAANERLDAVLETASDAIMTLDVDGTIRGWSRGAEALYGHSEEDAVGRGLVDLLDGSDAAERAGHLVAAARAGAPRREEAAHRRADGSAFTAAATLLPLDGGGTPSAALLVARDVGEQRRAAEELARIEARYRSLVEHLPLVPYVRSVDADGATTLVGPQVQKLLGYSAPEWLADPGLRRRLVHPDDRERVSGERAAAADGTRPLRTEYRMLARDGRTVWVREEATVVRDGRGHPLCIQGFLLDVGERRTAEERQRELRAAEQAALADAETRQRTLELVAETAALVAASSDARAAITQVAARVARDLADWCVVDVVDEEGTLVRLTAERVEPATPVPDPPPDPEPDVREVMRTGIPVLEASRMRLPLLARGGRAVGVLTLLAPPHVRGYRADDLAWGRSLAALVALTYENARLHAEVEARADANRVLTYVADGVFLLDRGGVVRLWNPAAEAITGVTAAAAVGKPAAEAVPGWQELAERVPVAAAHEPAEAGALPLDTPRGERWISISGVKFFGGTVYAFRDTTEAHRLDTLKTEFIATASHELRTPLAAVYGAAQTLRRHDFALDDAGRERFISLIVDESDRLGRIVNQILLANQLDVGRLDIVTEPFEAADLLERVAEAARIHSPPGITLEVHAAESVPPVAADKDRVRQILVNLVENAIKYSPDGGRVELGVAPAGEMVRFRVLDEGLGIPADEQPRIFEKFYRLDPDMTRGIGGTGLGLYICSELVGRMGGRIWVESRDGKGSAFFFDLPPVGTHRAQAGWPRAAGRTTASGTPAGDAA